jgi:hypothetical protein
VTLEFVLLYETEEDAKEAEEDLMEAVNSGAWEDALSSATGLALEVSDAQADVDSGDGDDDDDKTGLIVGLTVGGAAALALGGFFMNKKVRKNVFCFSSFSSFKSRSCLLCYFIKNFLAQGRADG